MRKVLVYWIQITDHGRCDEPRDHIWHTLDAIPFALDLRLVRIESRNAQSNVFLKDGCAAFFPSFEWRFYHNYYV